MRVISSRHLFLLPLMHKYKITIWIFEVPALWSACNFIFAFPLASFSITWALTSDSKVTECYWGSLVCIFRRKAAQLGSKPVIEWGFTLYFNKHWYRCLSFPLLSFHICRTNSFHQRLHKILSFRVGLWPKRCDYLVILFHFLHVFLNFSTGKRRSIVSSYSIRNNMSGENSIHFRDDHFCRRGVYNLYTSGNQEYASMITNKYSPVGSGPQKSMFSVCHGLGGKGDMWRGYGCFLGPLVWHARQFSIFAWPCCQGFELPRMWMTSKS